MLEAIWSMRYTTVDQVVALFGSNKSAPIINSRGTFRGGAEAIAKRLSKLTNYGYLQKIGRPIMRPTEPAIYTLGENAADLLINERNFDEKEVIGHTKQIKKYLASNRQYKHLHLKHRLEINKFRMVLALALRNNSKTKWVEDEFGYPLTRCSSSEPVSVLPDVFIIYLNLL